MRFDGGAGASSMSALKSRRREFNLALFSRIKLSDDLPKASALSLAVFLALIRSTRSVEEHPGDKFLASRFVNIVTMLSALSGSGAVLSNALPRSVMLDFRPSQSVGVG